jgi:1,4-dihydroxy-6-naphthoate synthase
MFHAMVHGKIDTEGLEFDVVLDDVESLNKRALGLVASPLQISKLSFHAYLYAINSYNLLQSGAALGRGCGPLLITNNKNFETTSLPSNAKIAVPGKYTTANMLFSLAYPKHQNTKFMVFSNIEQAVLSGEFDAGVIIHENRFTYQSKGLHKIIDLGAYWESQTGCAIPLGGIVVSKTISAATAQKINRVLQQSILYAFKNPTSSIDYIKQHAQEMDEVVIQNHINLYVNEYSVALGLEGNRAIDELKNKFKTLKQ